MMRFFMIFAIFTSAADCISIRCVTQTNGWSDFGHLKECLAYNVKSLESQTSISEVFLSNDDALDYKSFYIYQSPDCHYLPHGISKHFNHLQTLIVAHAGLEVITKDDLAPFENLRGLYIDHTNLKHLQKDLFKYNSKLETLSLQSNKFTNIEVGAFNHLPRVVNFVFIGNKCFNDLTRGRKNVEELFYNVESACGGGFDQVEDVHDDPLLLDYE